MESPPQHSWLVLEHVLEAVSGPISGLVSLLVVEPALLPRLN
jgi:hypothetical protein